MAHVRVPRLVLVLALLAVIVAAAAALRPAPARASGADIVSLASGSVIHLATPPFIQVGKRYALTWAGGGPAQTYLVKQIRPDGWILVEVAEEILRPELFIPGEFPTRWLNVSLAISIQEMRPVL